MVPTGTSGPLVLQFTICAPILKAMLSVSVSNRAVVIPSLDKSLHLLVSQVGIRRSVFSLALTLSTAPFGRGAAIRDEEVVAPQRKELIIPCAFRCLGSFIEFSERWQYTRVK